MPTIPNIPVPKSDGGENWPPRDRMVQPGQVRTRASTEQILGHDPNGDVVASGSGIVRLNAPRSDASTPQRP
jgi:hypothetical protein